MKATDRRLAAGAELYHAKDYGSGWRSVSPTRATVVDPAPRRIVRTRVGAFYLVSHCPDPAGNAVLVDLHHNGRPVERTAVPARELRGLWRETLAATGRTVADVKAWDARISALAAQPTITPDDLLALVANDPRVSDDVFTTIARAIEPEEHTQP